MKRRVTSLTGGPGGPAWASLSPMLAEWLGLSMTRDVVDSAGSEMAVARHEPDLHDPQGRRKSS